MRAEGTRTARLVTNRGGRVRVVPVGPQGVDTGSAFAFVSTHPIFPVQIVGGRLFRLILLFTLLPLLELTLLLRIGEWLGAGPTIGLVVVTGIVGAWLARREGLRTWAAVRNELAGGRMPGSELVHAALVLVAGVVLVTPGVLTDAAGLLLLIRPVREAVVRRTRHRLADRVKVQAVGFGEGFTSERDPDGGESSKTDRSPSGGRVIEI